MENACSPFLSVAPYRRIIQFIQFIQTQKLIHIAKLHRNATGYNHKILLIWYKPITIYN